MMEWDRLILETLKDSRPAMDEPPDWRLLLALYDGLGPADAAELDQAFLRMIDEEYRNSFAGPADDLPFDDVMVNLPAGMTPDDLVCIEAAALVAAERCLGRAYFAFGRLMRSPRWHAMYPRLFWLARESTTVQQKLAGTEAGRYMGAMLGLAAGDALGATLEFQSRGQIRAAYPDGFREIIGGGPFGWKPGEWTDDTAMALAVARGIAESPESPVDAVGRHFMEWFEGGPPDIGNTCRLALERFRSTGSWQAASTAVARELGRNAGGNGALMRTLPAALAYGNDVSRALAIARMTHPHPESDAAVAVYHRAVAAALRGGASREEVVKQGMDYLEGDAVSAPTPEAREAAASVGRRLERLRRLTEAEIRATGYVVDTLEAALWCFLNSESLEECIVRAVNLGEDTDTVGAIAGGLAGAYWGPGAVPRRWSTVIRNRSLLEEAAERLYAVACR